MASIKTLSCQVFEYVQSFNIFYNFAQLTFIN